MSEMFDVEKVDTKDIMVNYAYDFIINYNNSIFITEYETALRLANKIENLLDNADVIDRVFDDTESEEIVYIKSLGDDVFVINNVFDEDGEIYDEINADYVLLEDKLLIDEVIDEYIYAEEELEIIGYKEDDDIEPCICCERCHGCDKENIQLPYDLLDEAQQEYIDEIVNETEYSADTLADVFLVGYHDGVKTASLTISNAINEVIEED